MIYNRLKFNIASSGTLSSQWVFRVIESKRRPALESEMLIDLTCVPSFTQQKILLHITWKKKRGGEKLYKSRYFTLHRTKAHKKWKVTTCRDHFMRLVVLLC